MTALWRQYCCAEWYARMRTMALASAA
jgi:hypothetical protein